MKTIDIIVPEAGESITQVELARWLVDDGAFVEKDQEIAEIDSDKATLTITAAADGKITITTQEGASVGPGKVIGHIDAQAKAETKKSRDATKKEEVERDLSGQDQQDVVISPAAKKLMEELHIEPDWDSVRPDGKRITKKEILQAIASRYAGKEPHGRSGQQQVPDKPWGGTRGEKRERMSLLRKKVAERLVAVKNQTAMLTTFNEADMSQIIMLRKKYQQPFLEKYGIKLGFMSFFVKAITESIPYFPMVNSAIDENQIIVPGYADVGVAVSTPKGLMVPVIRNAEALSVPELEKTIHDLAGKARNNKITIEELSGGTISITNGGVFGSMMSTPIINPPQSAILGMHNIIERPVAIDGQVEIRPMMYLALSYDHRIIDGKESVSFLARVKECIEDPVRMLFQGKDPLRIFVGLDDQ